MKTPVLNINHKPYYKSVKSSFMKVLLNGIVAAFITFNCVAQPGSLDKTFGMQGKVITEFNDGSFETRDATKQADGKILITGIFDAAGDKQFIAIVRYLYNGELDNAFGDNGRVLTDLGYYGQHGVAIVADAQGKIFVAGEVVGENIHDEYDMVLLKYNTDGTPDLTFGNKGVVFKDFWGNDYPYDIALQEDGKIVLAGHSGQGFLTTRFLTNGELDTGFANNGSSLAFGGLAYAKSIFIQPDRKIVVGGSGYTTTCMLARYMTDGTYDSSFGVNGKATFYRPSLNISKIALTSTGNIVAVGMTGSASFTNIAIVQHTSLGKPDSTFGNNGIATLVLDSLYSRATDVAAQGDKIVIFGSTNTFEEGYKDILVARYLTNGQLDETFANKGIQRTEFGIKGEHTVAGFIDDDNKIVVAGDAYKSLATYKQEIIIARYYSDSTIEKDKYVKIKHWLHHHGITWEDKPNNLINYYSIQSSTNGNAFTEVARIFSNQHGGIQTYTASNNATANYRVAAISNTGNIIYSNTLSLVNITPTINLYPNPAKNNLQIQGLPAGTTKLRVTDLSGNTRIIATTNSTVYSINIAQLTSGNYLLNIKTANEIITKQFIKE
jgi:uncharacterized delta-60 repeat protein